MKGTTKKEYWLFQYKGAAGDKRTFDSSAPGKPILWKLTAFKQRIKKGDIVFFWRAGQTGSGLAGWGVVDGFATRQKGEQFDRIPVVTEEKFAEPIPRGEVRRVPEVSDLSVIMRGQTGTNFTVSTEQAYGLANLIRTRGYPAPEVDFQEVRSAVSRRIERDLSRIARAINELPPSELLDQAFERVQKIREQLQSADKEDDMARLKQDASEVDALLMDLFRDLELETGENEPALGVMDAIRQTSQQIHSDIDSLKRASELWPDSSAEDKSLTAEPVPPQEVITDTLSEEPPSQRVAGFVSSAFLPDEMPSLLQIPEDLQIWDWKERDLIDISEGIFTLARYISHQYLVPPKAIGIFGDWGSGKTFFMNALKSEVALTAWQSGLAVEKKAPTMFCSKVVQIDFNAWHYVESNLWASLAGHIFERLYSELESYKKKDTALDIDALYQALQTYHEARREHDQVEAAVRELEEEYKDIASKVRTQQQSIDTLQKQLIKRATDSLKEYVGRLGDEQREQLERLVGKRNLEELDTAAAQLTEVVHEGRRVASVVRTEIGSWGGRQYLVAFILTVVVMFGVPLLIQISNADDWLGAQSWFTKITAAIGAYVTAATGALSWLAVKGGKLVKLADGLRKNIAEARKKADETGVPELRSAQERLAKAKTELAQKEQRLQVRRNQLDTIQTRLQQENPGVQLKDFLESRVRDQTYQQHLGLISLVRKDFEFLSDLMERFWRSRSDSKPFAEVQLLNQEGKTITKRVPFFERIVLYIDDLDRCPPDKVVDVLQAVHLLMGFNLFVVVVGVDVRWVGRSLLKHYPDLLADYVPFDEENGDWRQASSDDYLEKIFQIPFRIPPMNENDRGTFVTGLLQERFLGGRDDDTLVGPVTPLELNPKELTLYPEESECINRLHISLGRSPRRVKRFVDVYRLMRSGMEEGNVESLIRTKQYHLVLAQFALLTGAPNLAPTIIGRIHREWHEPDSSQEELPPKWFSEWFENMGLEVESAEESEIASATAVFEYLDSVDELDRQAINTHVEEWLPKVVRYSFREIRMPGHERSPDPWSDSDEEVAKME